MFTLEELEQLAAFYDFGTLSKAAEQLHISQPTITRTMKRLEEAFGVPLFIRRKNRIALNETGLKAVEQAKQVLAAADAALKSVRDFDKSLHTITVSSCAPAPLWYVLPALAAAFPAMTIASSLKDSGAVCSDLASGHCQLAILPEPSDDGNLFQIPFLRESLSVCLPRSHDLAGRVSVSFSDLNGFNFLLRSEIGFWDGMCRAKMPSSRFLVQTDEFEFNELARESSLPYFVTDLAGNPSPDRIPIPISDQEARVTYYLVCRPPFRSYVNAVKPLEPSCPSPGSGSTCAGRKPR